MTHEHSGRTRRHPKRRRGSSSGPKARSLTGTVRLTGDGAGRLIPDASGQPAVHLPADQLRGLRAGDSVTVELEVGRKGKVRGRVVAVGQRGPGLVVGILKRTHNAVFVIPSDNGPALLVEPQHVGEAKDGDAVEALVTKESKGPNASTARVERVLGSPTDPKVQVEMIVRSQGWPLEFASEVHAEVAQFPDVDPARVLVGGRRDLRAIPHVTIDGEDARDFDDAVSAVPERGGYRVWVSIADVSHYVRPNSQVDRSARERATSVYFPDRVLPMLPERLSNDLCSLRPNLPRLTLTAELHVDPEGRFADVEVYPSLIESAGRLTYNEVQAVIDELQHPIPHAAPKAPHRHAELIGHLMRAARYLRGHRARRGSLDLDLPEPKIKLDERGVAASIQLRDRLEAHRLIEDLMVAANEAVAEHLLARDWASVFRVHESPDPLKLTSAARWAGKLGVHFDPQKGSEPRHVAAFVERVKAHPLGGVLQSLVLRMMAQARYSEENLGHFGLASQAYLHFTSPIRRYPDLAVHRSLRALWEHHRPLQGLEALAQHCSSQERRAMEAERAVVQLMACQVAEQHVGEVLDAVVTGVHAAGAFVRASDPYVEGLVGMESLGHTLGEYVELLEDEQMLLARRSGRRLRIGDRIRVLLAGVNMRKRYIDFTLELEERERSAVRTVTGGARAARQAARERSGRGGAAGRSRGGAPGRHSATPAARVEQRDGRPQRSDGRPSAPGRPSGGGRKKNGRGGRGRR